MVYEPKIDWAKPTAQFLGRFQPWHKGHRAVFDEILKKGNIYSSEQNRTSQASQCLIMVRSMPLNEDNPLSFVEVKEIITKDLEPEYHDKYEIIQVPNITNVFYGRTVGYDVERIHIPEELESISATKIRAEQQYYDQKFWRNRQ